jgi:hypothetical protein
MECNLAAEKYTLELLTSLIGKCSFTTSNMHNGTASGTATILNMLINVLGFRGKSQVEFLTSAERGTLVNSYLHECLRKFHAKDICISTCEKNLDFTATAVRNSNLTNMNLRQSKVSKSAVFESCVRCGWSGKTGHMRLTQRLKTREDTKPDPKKFITN